MNRKADLRKLSTNLQSVFGGKNWHTLWQVYKLVKHWQEVVGENVARNSMPAYIQKNILWIYVDNSIWMQQLQGRKPELLDKIRTFQKDLDIKDIRWLMRPTDEIPAKKQKNSRLPKEINPAEQKNFEEIAASVQNEKCRDALCKLWRVYHKNN